MEQKLRNVTVDQLCEVIDLLYTSMDDYLYIYDFEHDFYYISPNAIKRFQIPENGFHNVIQNMKAFVYPPDYEDLVTDLTKIQNNETRFHNLQYRWLDSDNNPVWINSRGYVYIPEQKPTYMLGCINEIGNRQKADNISGLLGESSLHCYLKELFPHFPDGYLLRLGIDDFKGINEKLGMEYGDTILKQTAECITRCISPKQKLYSLPADEYMVLDFSGGTSKDARKLYKQIRRKIDQYVERHQYEAVFTISGGVLESNQTTDLSLSDIMKLSEFSLNEAKRRGRNQCYHFHNSDYDAFLKQKELKALLQKSVRNHFEGFEAYYQPLFSLADHTLYGAETLMRFRCEKYGIVSPAEFIPALEETGLIIPLGRWILHEGLSACKTIRQWIPEFRISVNVSYVQIMKSDIIDEILRATEEYDIPTSQVVIELTESGALESDVHLSKLWSKIREKGIRLALDDFGTGYSNFHYLYDLQPDIIKIDRSFTAKAMENDYEYNLLSLMSGMVHNLNLKICIEGIETEEEKRRIMEFAPDYSQGFYFGKPCPFDQFMEQFIKPLQS